MGIEPTYPAWKAGVLPLNYTRMSLCLKSVGVTGFEPATSWSQTRRSSQAEPHPVVQFSFLFLTATNFIIHNNIAIVNTYFKYFLDFISISFLIKIMQGKFCLAGCIKLHNYVRRLAVLLPRVRQTTWINRYNIV